MKKETKEEEQEQSNYDKMQNCKCEKPTPIFLDYENEISINECRLCNRIWYVELSIIEN